MNVPRVLGLTLFLFLVVLSAFGMADRETGPEPATEGKPLVAVSVLPQAYFVQRLAGDRMKVITLVGPGQNPHSYEPTPRQMAQLAKAKLWYTRSEERRVG